MLMLKFMKGINAFWINKDFKDREIRTTELIFHIRLIIRIFVLDKYLIEFSVTDCLLNTVYTIWVVKIVVQLC